MAELTHKSASVPKKSAKGKRSKHKKGDVYTGYLYSDPSVWDGAASLLDLFGRFDDYNYSRTVREADARGLYSDCYAVAHDFWDAVRLFEGEQSLEKLPKQYRLFDPDKNLTR
jgi:hypothetical protein